MTTARQIIADALTFGLNRLAPGETLDADTAAVCLSALNSIADEINGGGQMLWREVMTLGTVTGASGTLGTTWALPIGVTILGAVRSYAGSDRELSELTFAQYQAIPDKTTAGLPDCFAHDGHATVYVYPASAGVTIKLRTKAAVSDFADLDTDYGMAQGARSAMAAFLAEKMGPTLVGGVPANVAKDAAKARSRLLSKVEPAILDAGCRRVNLFAGG